MRTTTFGLPEKVIFCKKCVESNQRFLSSVQHLDKPNQKKETALFDEHGVCLACRYYERKEKIDWNLREKELKDMMDRCRSKNGAYDVLIPGSGGKDSIFTSFILKEKYNMHPLTCTWSPGMYTNIGWKNYNSWLDSGFDNFLFSPNKKIHRLLTKLAFKNLLHPFQPFVIGQVTFASKIAMHHGIELIVYGDGYAERGIGKKDLTNKKINNIDIPRNLYAKKDDEIFFGGIHEKELRNQYKLDKADLDPFMPIKEEMLYEKKLKILTINNYINYNPQSNYYFAKEKSNFQVNPDGRSEGTYTKYSSLDDKLDGLHYYTWFIKTGRGRATEDATIEVRNKIITRDEAVALVKKFDGEFPKKYFNDCLKYMDITENEFFETIEKFRPAHLWTKVGNEWKLKNPVWK
tara:strand:- start:111 stop:1325 length:1215 start_codon:yes stop_codon:yes gene_type:complete